MDDFEVGPTVESPYLFVYPQHASFMRVLDSFRRQQSLDKIKNAWEKHKAKTSQVCQGCSVLFALALQESAQEVPAAEAKGEQNGHTEVLHEEGVKEEGRHEWRGFRRVGRVTRTTCC